ncbi:MAG: hypothetical protein RL106_881 [Bacteroidota bacterium]|jgi:nicotinamide riboside kinase
MRKGNWVIAGPESSGKTSLWESLGNIFNTAQLIPEANRIWLTENQITPPYSSEQLTSIFEYSQQQFDQAPAIGFNLWDTDELNLLIWSQWENHPMQHHWMKRFLDNDHRYILCPPNIPWESDPLRQGPESRDALFREHLQLLSNKKYYLLESNQLEDRIQEALFIIDHLG